MNLNGQTRCVKCHKYFTPDSITAVYGNYYCSDSCKNKAENPKYTWGEGEFAIPQRNKVDAIIRDRENDYGDAHTSHTNIGLAWTALLKQKYKINFTLKAEDVALMMASFKMMREAFKHKEDNIVDQEAYFKFYKEFIGRGEDENKD